MRKRKPSRLVRISSELLDDSKIDLQGWMASQVARKAAEALDTIIHPPLVCEDSAQYDQPAHIPAV